MIAKISYLFLILLIPATTYATPPDPCIFQLRTGYYHLFLDGSATGPGGYALPDVGIDGVTDFVSLGFSANGTILMLSTVVDEQGLCQLLEGLTAASISSSPSYLSAYSEYEIVSPDNLAQFVSIDVTVDYHCGGTGVSTISEGYITLDGQIVAEHGMFSTDSGFIFDYVNGITYDAHTSYSPETNTALITNEAIIHLDNVSVGSIVEFHRTTYSLGGAILESTTVDNVVNIVDSY